MKWALSVVVVAVLILLVYLLIYRKESVFEKPEIDLNNVPKLVMAFYHGWYGSPEGPTKKWVHWNHWIMDIKTGKIVKYHNPEKFVDEGRRDIGAVHYPLLGPYDVRSLETLKAHFKWAEDAGINVFVFDWFGPPGGYIDKNFDIMLKAATILNSSLRFAILYDGYEYRKAPPEEVINELYYIIRNYGSHPKYLRLQEFPVTFIYASQYFPCNTWAKIIRELRGKGLKALFLCDAVSKADEYLKVFDGIYTYSPAGVLNAGQDLLQLYSRMMYEAKRYRALCALTVLPGYDDTAVRIPGFIIERKNGETYNYTWSVVLELNPRWVMICSWNEWHEGTEIEPSLEYGYKYLELTKVHVSTFKKKP
mgnify:CR=1 FL=1